MAVLSRAVAVCLAACVGPALGANQRTLDARRAQGECAAAATSGDLFLEGLITGPLPSTETTQAEASITAADNIEIRYGRNFKVLLERRAQTMYVLTQCGTTPPTQAQIDAVQIKPSGFTQKSFTVPLQAVASETTINLAFFEALGLTDRVRYVTSGAVSACFQQANSCGAATGNKTEQLPQVDAWFMDCGWHPTTYATDCSNINQEAKAVHVSTSQDPGPLHSAEHIKFVAAFFNKEAEASRLFSQTVASYTSLQSSYSSQPVVAWISDAFGSGLALSQATYKLQYVTHAGGVNVDGDAVMSAIGGGKMTKSTAASGSTYTLRFSAYTGTAAEKKSQASQAFFQALRSLNVSAVIDEVYANPSAGGPQTYTMANFTSAYGLNASSDLQFMVDQMVIRVDGTLSENSDLAWYESRIVHPEWASAGLARQLHSDTSRQQMYFRNIAKGETPTMIMKSECSAGVAACNANAYPQIIPLMDGSSVSAAATARGALAALLLSVALAMRG